MTQRSEELVLFLRTLANGTAEGTGLDWRRKLREAADELMNLHSVLRCVRDLVDDKEIEARRTVNVALDDARASGAGPAETNRIIREGLAR